MAMGSALMDAEEAGLSNGGGLEVDSDLENGTTPASSVGVVSERGVYGRSARIERESTGSARDFTLPKTKRGKN